MRRAWLPAVLALVAASCDAGPGRGSWETLEPGLELGRFPGCTTAPAEPPAITVVRVDPGKFELRVASASATPERRSRTVRSWAEAHGLVVATNAGMYHQDFVRHVGLLVDGEHVNNPVAVATYKSALAFNPLRAGLPPFELADLDQITIPELRERYATVVQNLRMIAPGRRNVWAASEKRSATAALAVDRGGRLLFLFHEAPISVHDLNRCLLALPVGIERAQYLEGGAEAALLVRAGGREIDLAGETTAGFSFPIPNVLGVARRATSPTSEAR